MAQHDYDIENSSFPAFRTNLNGVLSAINSSNSGSSRPSSAVAGTIWLDTSGAATAQLLKLYDGAADILLGTVNFTANTVDWADSSVGGIAFKQEGTNFTDSLLIGHSTTGTLSDSGAIQNTIVGIDAGNAITGGDRNTLVGFNSGGTIGGGADNTLIGANAGKNVGSNSNITAVGSNALSVCITHSNVALGKDAGDSIVNGQSNIVIGTDAGQNITNGSGNVIIGSVDAGSATGDRQLMISGYDGSTTTTWISGDNSGNVSIAENLNLSGSNKELRFYEGTNYVGFEAPALTADKIWVLPAADGSADQVLKTDGSGNLGFATAGGGAAGTLDFQSDRSGNLTISADTATEIVFNAEAIDTGSKYNVSTGRYTPAVAGNYFVTAACTFDPVSGQGTAEPVYLKIRKNGVATEYGQVSRGGETNNSDFHLTTSAIITLDADDYISVWTYCVGINQTLLSDQASFNGFRLS